ncbi:MAG: Ig-like domain repeat protein, partial [Abitibacteriaceae bacterium]|nr:Ig-like domain repeat protein [Abditibacteriaceae bacterium]
SKWVSSPVQLATTLSGNPNSTGFVTWSRTSGLPSGTDLIQASYTITATATNNAGVAAVRSINAILGVSDTRPPYVRINSPTALSRLNHLPTLSGVANDNPGGTGLSRVVVSIQRNSDGQYFDGFGWSPTRALLPTSLSKPAVPGNENTYTWTRSSVPGGADLSDGPYQIIARAYDYNNNIAATTVFVFIDKQAPTLAFVSPLPGTAAQNLNVTQINAQDAPGGSGLAHVDLTIRRNFDGAYWNGTTFTLNPTALPTSFGGNNFIYHGHFTNKQLSEGSYTLQATAYDKAGNRSVATSNVFVERTAPTVKFVTPAANTGASALPVINGQAFDNFGGSGLATVTLTIQRQSDNAYYNGSTFTSKPTTIGAKVTGSLFSFNTGFNTTNLRDGNYILTATATDRAGNSSTTKSTITIDRTPPQKVAFTTPTNGSTLASLSTVKGTATDNVVGSGIEQVVVYIQRRKDALYWTGAGWGPATALKTTLSAEDAIGPVTWTVATKLPSGATLQNDVYVLSAVATDRSGNTKSTAIRVTVNALATDSTATISPASSIALSKTNTQVATSSVQLGFAGALDVNSATEVEHYEVVVNGQLVAVQSVAYSASTHTVTLGLEEGVLHSGDSVVVSWTGLQDTQQRKVTGQATLTVR